MAQMTVSASEKSQVRASTAKKTARLFFIDNLRVALVVLVLLHHVAMVYGASAPFYYVEPPFTDPAAFKSLLIFALVNQAWFMGAFFLLAGYFTPGSFDRKGPGAFLKNRLIRLGIPLIIYTFLLNPIAELGVLLMPAALTGITTELTWQSFWQAYPDRLGIGPLWFIAMLLLFTIGYALWGMLVRNRASSTRIVASKPGYFAVALFTVALAAASFLLRRAIPLGESVTLYTDLLSFPTIAYLPQYLSFFILGAVASRRNWFQGLSGSMGFAGLLIAAAASVLLFPLAFSGEMFSLELTEALGSAMGNGHWQSAAYALWDAAFAVGLCLFLITLFRRVFNRQRAFGRFLSQHGYTVYIIHIPIVVFLTYALREIELNSILKSALAAVIVVPACFIIAAIIRKLPLASRVL